MIKYGPINAYYLSKINLSQKVVKSASRSQVEFSIAKIKAIIDVVYFNLV